MKLKALVENPTEDVEVFLSKRDKIKIFIGDRKKMAFI
jgi:hypothetical protein